MRSPGSEAGLDVLPDGEGRAAAENGSLHSVPLLPVTGVSSDGSGAFALDCDYQTFWWLL